MNAPSVRQNSSPLNFWLFTAGLGLIPFTLGAVSHNFTAAKHINGVILVPLLGLGLYALAGSFSQSNDIGGALNAGLGTIFGVAALGAGAAEYTLYKIGQAITK